MDLGKIKETPHRRFNPLTREWVLVSPHRTQRPWQGKVEKTSGRGSAALRPDLLSVSGQSAGRRGRKSGLLRDFCFRQRFRRAAAERC